MNLAWIDLMITHICISPCFQRKFGVEEKQTGFVQCSSVHFPDKLIKIQGFRAKVEITQILEEASLFCLIWEDLQAV